MAGKGSKWSVGKFIEKSSIVHENKYDYSRVKNLNRLADKVEIVCPKHGVFKQIACIHKNGSGCPKCSTEQRNNKNKTSQKEYMDKCNKVYNNKYDYSLLKYENNKTKVLIICPYHGLFEQEASSHSKGYGCSKCSRDNKENLHKNRFKKFVEKSNKIHGNKYDYSKVNFKGGGVAVDIICKYHGVFTQKPENHLKGKGCSVCASVKNLNRSGKSEGYLYLIEFKDYLKVGISTNINKRVCTLKWAHGDIENIYKIYNTIDYVCSKEYEIKSKYQNIPLSNLQGIIGKTECFPKSIKEELLKTYFKDEY